MSSNLQQCRVASNDMSVPTNQRNRDYQSPMSYVEDVICSLPVSSQDSLTIHIEWNFKRFLKTQMKSVDQLGTLLVLNGSWFDAEAVICKEYCVRIWPEDGLFLLNALLETVRKDEIIWKLPSGTSLTFQTGAESYESFPRESATIILNGTKENFVKIVQQLAWFSTILRVGGKGLALSKFSLSQTKSPNSLTLQMLELEQVPEFGLTDSKSMSPWHPLFATCVIAHKFPIRTRKNERGIELPFAALWEMADILGPSTFEGGIVLKGFSSIVFPVVSEQGNDGTQWQLILAPEGTLAQLSLLKPVRNRWLCTPAEFETMIQARTFLSCYPRTQDTSSGFDRFVSWVKKKFS